MYSNDPNYPEFTPVKKVRLWPYVVSGLIVAMLLWAYFEPMPAHTPAEQPTIGPNSPLYGPIRGEVKP